MKKFIFKRARNRRRMDNNGLYSFFSKKALPIALVIMIATQLVSPFFVVFAEMSRDSKPNYRKVQEGSNWVVDSWTDLRSLIEDPNNASATLNIIIEGPIAADRTITIGANQTINLSGRTDGKNDAVIYGNVETVDSSGNVTAVSKFDQMFLVNGGTLNVDGTLTFSGKRIYGTICGSNPIDKSNSNTTYIPGYPQQDIYIDLSDSAFEFTYGLSGGDLDKSKLRYVEGKNKKFNTFDVDEQISIVNGYIVWDSASGSGAGNRATILGQKPAYAVQANSTNDGFKQYDSNQGNFFITDVSATTGASSAKYLKAVSFANYTGAEWVTVEGYQNARLAAIKDDPAFQWYITGRDSYGDGGKDAVSDKKVIANAKTFNNVNGAQLFLSKYYGNSNSKEVAVIKLYDQAFVASKLEIGDGTSYSEIRGNAPFDFSSNFRITLYKPKANEAGEVYIPDTNSQPSTAEGETYATLVDNEYYFVSSNGKYLYADTGVFENWKGDYYHDGGSDQGHKNRHQALWKYSSADQTLHNNVNGTEYVIYYGGTGNPTIQDINNLPSTTPTYSFKIDGSKVYADLNEGATSLFTSSSSTGTETRLYSAYDDANPVTSVTTGNSYYVKAGASYLKANGSGAEWTTYDSGSDNAYKWKVSDGTEVTNRNGTTCLVNESTDPHTVIYNNGTNIIGTSIDTITAQKYSTNNPLLRIGENGNEYTIKANIGNNTLFTTQSEQGTQIIVTTDKEGNNEVAYIDNNTNALVNNQTYYLKTIHNNTEYMFRYFNNTNKGEWNNSVAASNRGDWFKWTYQTDSDGGKLVNTTAGVFIYSDSDGNISIRNIDEMIDETPEKDGCVLAINAIKEYEHKSTDFPTNSDNQKGYFITAKNSSTVNIKNAVFRDLWVDDKGSVKNIAPILIDGSNFTMQSGSIQNNRVGYTADDTKSGMPVNSNDNNNTWRYVGAELGANTPNNIPVPTKTAGGIIFTKSSIASITGLASINNNKADVGGILVQGDSIVVMGGEKSGDTVNASDGGHIDRNVGFHYSGAALVEGGGTLVMAGENSTMNYNVSWNKGGAVWVTEYGTSGDGFGVRKGYQKPLNLNQRWADSNGNVKPGKFLMLDGKIQYNTAFHRGGAINVESDFVILKKGEISYNNCRALGGGIYVEGDYADYNYTLQIDDGYIGHNYAVTSDPSLQNTTIKYHSENDVLIGHGYLDSEEIEAANDILDRKIRTGNDTSTSGTLISTKYEETGFDRNALNPLSETDISDDTSDKKVWIGYRRGTGWEGNGGGIWLCPIGSTGVFNMHDGHEVYIDDNYASGATNADPLDGTDIYLWPGTGHIIAKEMNGEVWVNEGTNAKVPELGGTDANSRIYTGPLALINKTTDGNDTVHPTYDEDKVYSELKIVDNLSRNGGGIAADGTVLFGKATDVNRHEAELTLTKRWTINNPEEYLYFKMFYVDGDTEVEMVGYDFELNGAESDASAYSIVQEYGSLVDESTGETLWKARFAIPVTATLADDTVVPVYKFVDPDYPNDRTKDIDPSNDVGSARILELLQSGTKSLNIAPGSWKLEIREYDAEGKQIKDAHFKDIKSLTFTSKVNPIKVFGGQGQELSETHGYDIKFSVAEFAQEVVNSNDTTEKYINNVVHENFYSFDDVFEYEIMAYVPADADEVIIYDTLQTPLMFVDRNGNPQFVLQNNSLVTNPSFVNGSTPSLVISDSSCTPAWINDFISEPFYQIEGIASGENYFIKTKTGNYYYKGKDGNNWVKSSLDWVINGYESKPKVNFSGSPVLQTYEYNDHKGDGTGTVSKAGQLFTDPITGSNHVVIGVAPSVSDEANKSISLPSVNVGENTIYVKIDNTTGIDKVKGKWVKLSFNAAIKPTFKNINKLKQYGWVNDTYNKQGSPLPEGKASIETVVINQLQNYLTTDYNSSYIISKVIKVDNRLYAKVGPTEVSSASSDQYHYYQLNLNGDKEWYRTYFDNGNTARINIDGVTNASDGQPNAGKDKNNVGLEGIWNVQYYFHGKNQNNGNWADKLVKSEETEGVLISLEKYLAANNDSIKTLKSYDRGAIHVYIVETNNGNYYQRTQALGNVTVTDAIWYKTELKSGNTVLTPLNGNSLPVGPEKDKNGNALEGYYAVKDTSRYGSQASVRELNPDEFKGMSTVKAEYNWPVIKATQPHSGEMNEAKYVVVKNNAQSISKTNVVTFDVVQPEKYVNNKVHDVLKPSNLTVENNNAFESFDKTFEYEIMVYVPNNAKEIIIWDTLNDSLMFVDKYNQPQYRTLIVGTDEDTGADIPNSDTEADNYFMKQGTNDTNLGMTMVEYSQLQYYLDNNHKGDGTGTVSTNEKELHAPIDSGNIKVGSHTGTLSWDSITEDRLGKNIYLKIDANSGIETVKGKWVKFAFNAKIKPSAYPKLVEKISKDNRYTTVISDAIDYDSQSNSATVVGYYYRPSQYTIYKMNAVDYNITTDSATPAGYYTKDSSGNYTVAHTGTPEAGTDYIYFYECDYIYYTDDLASIPTGAQSKPAYIKKDWNKTDAIIGWERVVDDGSVSGAETLYNNAVVYKYADVQKDLSHAGLANKANYEVRFDNEWKHSVTNTVTTVPLLRTISVNKIWSVMNDTILPSPKELLENLELYWEKTEGSQHGKKIGNITELYKDKINIYAKNDITIGEKTKYTWVIEVRDLPRLEDNLHYFLKEKAKMGEDYNNPSYYNPNDAGAKDHAHDGGEIENAYDDGPDKTKLVVEKHWDSGEDISNLPQVKVQLLANGQPIPKRDDSGAIIYSTDNPANPEVDESSIITLPFNGSYRYTFEDLDRYEKDANGDYVEEYVLDETREYYYDINNIWYSEYSQFHCEEDINGCIIYEYTDKYVYEVEKDVFGNEITGQYTDPNGNKLPDYIRDPSTGEKIKVTTKKEVEYSIKILEDPENYILSVDSQKNKRYSKTTTTSILEAYDYDPTKIPPAAEHLGIGRAYVVSGYERKFRQDGTYTDIPFTAESLREINSTEDDSVFASRCLLGPLPMTSPGSRDYTVCEYTKLVEYDEYDVDLVNTKPQIEKYIEKDVHLETYYTNSFTYDIMVYVPQEATEIEITDELLSTLKLDSFLEPVVEGEENKKITGYNIRELSSMSNPINLAVHSSNNHYIHGTVGPRHVNAGDDVVVEDTVKANITVDGKSFKANITNIVPAKIEHIIYEHGEYIDVAKIDGSEQQYMKDSEVTSEFYPVNNLRYRVSGEPYYIEAQDNNGTHYKIWNSNKQRIQFVEKDTYLTTGTYEGYSIVDDKTYVITNDPSVDQKIGGYYVQLSFNARFDLDETKEAALKEWVENPLKNSKNTPNPDLDWDVITDSKNTGWDDYVKQSLINSGYTGTEKYVTDSNSTHNLNYSDFNPLTEYLDSNGKKIETIITDNNYYYVKAGGEYYQYRRTYPGDNVGYRNLTGQWFKVVTPSNGRDPSSNADIYDLNGNRGLNVDGQHAWLGTSYNDVVAKFTGTSSSITLLPLEPDLFVMINDDKYYIKEVADKYAPEDAYPDKTIYRKVDWGRGDGGVIRTYPSDFQGDQYSGKHAGIVNTATYEVTYGNGYKSNHKSNTVTVVPHIFSLPSSGGIGTYWITILGSMFIALAVNYLVNINKRRRRKRGGVSG